MKKVLVLALAFMLMIPAALASTEYENEIQFRSTPWGISFTEADEVFSEYGLMGMTGESMKFYPIVQLYSDTYDWDSSPEYHDINIIGNCWNKEFEVAGYKTSDIRLHFAYKVVDGVITHEEPDSMMYGAQYIFEPADADSMVNDLTSKLSGLYGDIDKDGTRSLNGIWDYKWWIWNGANNTAVSLTWEDCINGEYKDKVWISYFTNEGDDWLYAASDGEKERLLREERAGAASGNTDGL